METRKAQLTGGTTYTVSLPKSWATEQGITSGSTLYLYPNEDGSILVEPETSADNREYTATVDVHSYTDGELSDAIYALYFNGVEKITLIDSTDDVTSRQRVVSAALSQLIGFEIMQATPEKLVLENMTNAESISIRKSALRLRLIVLSMQQDAIQAFVENDTDLATEVIKRDDEVDKLLALVMRYFQRSLVSLEEVVELDLSRAKLFEYYYTTRQLERVADHAEKVAELALQCPDAISDELKETVRSLGDESRHIIEQSSNTVLSDLHISEAFETLPKRDELVTRIERLDRELYDHDSAKTAHQLGLVLDSLKRSADYGANIAETAIQNAARTESLPDQL